MRTEMWPSEIWLSDGYGSYCGGIGSLSFVSLIKLVYYVAWKLCKQLKINCIGIIFEELFKFGANEN